jgi:hypothetical protein
MVVELKSVTQREEHSVVEAEVLRKIYGPKKQEIRKDGGK